MDLCDTDAAFEVPLCLNDLVLILVLVFLFAGCRSPTALAPLRVSVLWQEWPFPHEGLL